MFRLNKLLYILCFLGGFLSASNVVINEVLYDAEGNDSGNEWIELYNAGTDSVNLSGWSIQKASSEFQNVYSFNEGIFLDANSYLLLGGEFVSGTDITANISFYNSSGSSVAIRLISGDSLYTDTVIYGSPNTNNLPDDVTIPATNFAPDVDMNSGHVLARKVNGEDTDNCAEDWFESEFPTPGEANIYPLDLALSDCKIEQQSNTYFLTVLISNLSTMSVDNGVSNLEIFVDNSYFDKFILPAIAGEDSIEYTIDLGQFTTGYYVAEITLNCMLDLELENNFQQTSLLAGASPLILNEVMYNPVDNRQEWIEIYNRTNVDNFVDNFMIIDKAANEILFSGKIEAKDFVVICQYPDLLLQAYPEIDGDKIIKTSGWAGLNNADESLQLTDKFYTQFDSLYYEGSECEAGISLERQNPYSDNEIQWLASEADSGATPAYANSILPFEKDVALCSVELNRNGNSLEHNLKVEDKGLFVTDSFQLVVKQFIDNQEDNVLIQTSHTLDDSIELEFNSSLSETGYYTFLYSLTAEDDINPENDVKYKFLNNQALPFVVNEIMYDPAVDEPEWLELKINRTIDHLTGGKIVIDEDTVEVEFDNSEYLLITEDEESAEFLQQEYNLNKIPQTGLMTLANTGKNIKLLDWQNNQIESFTYSSDWNDDMKGVSIERINSELNATQDNWGPAVENCTPGYSNSIFVEYLPTNLEIALSPNPFSPYQGESTIINYDLPEVLSTVTIRIFDLKGRMLRKLIDQELQSAEGEIIWNGRDKNNRKVTRGVYILKLEATARSTEKVYEKIKTVVVAK